MSRKRNYSAIIEDEFAEGSTAHDEPEARHDLRQTMTLPAFRTLRPDAPAGETGILPAIGIPGESIEHDDRQDASRTTAESRPVPAPQTAPSSLRGRAPTVLIVEDSDELAEIIQATLERLRIITIHESHAQRALARLQELKPDIMLLDIGLPDMSGWKLLEGIKDEVKTGGKMPAVIVISAHGDATNHLMGKLQNVHSYLVKPFTQNEVERVVMQALGGRVG